MQILLIDTISLLKSFLEGLIDCEGEPPKLYVDLEGNNLSRHGTLSLVTILVEPRKKVYLIDVTTLGRSAFETGDSSDRTLRDIFESIDVIKVFFDIRNDSDALFSLHGVSVNGIWDLQLLELASRPSQKRQVNGLAKCIERDLQIGYAEKRKWNTIKEHGRKLFDPARGGSYAVFDQRPLSEEMEEYCVQDVAFMPHLCEIYREKLCDAWWIKIQLETQARIRLSQGLTFNGKGRHMAEAPLGWINWRPSPMQKTERSLLAISVLTTVPSEPAASAEPSGGVRSLPAAVSQASAVASTANNVQVFRPKSPSTIEEALGGLQLNSGDASSDSDLDRFCHRESFYSRSDSDDTKDYTACDSECGYCGNCMY